MTTSTAERLQEIFRAVLQLPADADVTRVRRLSTDKWDSLAHVSLVVGIESEFGLALDTAESLRLTSYEAAEILLEEKGL